METISLEMLISFAFMRFSDLIKYRILRGTVSKNDRFHYRHVLAIIMFFLRIYTN